MYGHRAQRERGRSRGYFQQDAKTQALQREREKVGRGGREGGRGRGGTERAHECVRLFAARRQNTSAAACVCVRTCACVGMLVCVCVCVCVCERE